MGQLWEIATERTRQFDAEALAYDRFRPRYPEALFDDLLSLVDSPSPTAIEIGAGTGIATVPLVERGVRVLAVEPSASMAEILTEKLRDEVEVIVDRFQDWVPDRVADLVVAFNAWHWVDPRIAVDRVAEVVRPGGALVLVWTEVLSYGPAVLQDAAGLHPDDPSLDGIMSSRQTVDADERFDPPVVVAHEFSRSLDADSFIAVTRTYGGPHSPEREASIRTVIDESCGGAVTKAERATAFVYRRA